MGDYIIKIDIDVNVQECYVVGCRLTTDAEKFCF